MSCASPSSASSSSSSSSSSSPDDAEVEAAPGGAESVLVGAVVLVAAAAPPPPPPAAPAPHHPAAPSVTTAAPHDQGPSDGLSSLAEASALMASAGTADGMAVGQSAFHTRAPSSHAMNSHSSNKRKRGQHEPPRKSATSDLGGSPEAAALKMDSDQSEGGVAGSSPSAYVKPKTKPACTTGGKDGKPLPKLLGRGRPRCSKAEARLKHAAEPLLGMLSIARNAPWEVKYDLVREYKRRYGTANVPTAFCSGDIRLGQWLAAQRQARRKGTLGDERVAMLEELGVAWKKNGMNGAPPPPVVQGQLRPRGISGGISGGESVADTSVESSPEKLPPEIVDLTPEEEAHWNTMCSLLKKFRDREGHTVPSMYHVEDGEELGKWLREMKQHHRCRRLGQVYVKRLEEAGVMWDSSEDTWRIFLELFKQYVARAGNGKVNQAHFEDGRKLGVWVVIQRKHFREGRLSDDRIKLLDDAGMDWDPHNSSWEKFYALSVQYALREGTIKVRADHLEDGEFINRWLRRQKRQKHEGRLTEEQMRRMEQLPGWSWELGETFEDMFALLLRFKAKRGHINVPSKHMEEGKKLGAWLDKHKQDKRSGKIDPRIEETFNSLGMQWEILETQWEQYYLLLLQFIEREGHADVMQRHEEAGERLGIWVATQRAQYKKGKLQKSRIEKLDQVDFIWQKKRGRAKGLPVKRRVKKPKKENEDDTSEASSEGDRVEEEEINYDDEFDLDLDGEEADHLDTEGMYDHDDHHHFYYDDGDLGDGEATKTVGV